MTFVRSFILGCVSLSLFIFFSHKSPFLSSSKIIDTACSVIVYPILKIPALVTEPIRSLLMKKWTIAGLQQEVDTLRYEKEQLISQLVESQGLLNFMQETQALYEFQKQFPQQGVMAHVIMRHLAPDEHFYLVDKGSHHGITNGMVAVYQNNLVGRVDETFPFYSKVVLITDQRCKVAAWCGQKKARGIHEGMQDKEMTVLKFISHLDPIRVGELVLSSGEGVVFPYGYALGSIVYCAIDGVFQSVKIKPLIQFDSLTHCLIIQKGKTAN